MHTTKHQTASKILQPKKEIRGKSSGPRNLPHVVTTAKAEVHPMRVKGSGAANMRDATVRMKKVTGGGSVLRALGEDGEKAKIAALQKLSETDHTHGRNASVPLEVEKQVIVEYAAGASPRQLEIKYDLTQGYVNHALRRRYGSPETAKLALQGLVNENALACMVKAAIEIPNMSGPQAVMSGAILIDKGLALEKSIADRPKTIDFGALADMGKTLKVLREIAAKPLRQKE